jgi:hypothetical protein
MVARGGRSMLLHLFVLQPWKFFEQEKIAATILLAAAQN